MGTWMLLDSSDVLTGSQNRHFVRIQCIVKVAEHWTLQVTGYILSLVKLTAIVQIWAQVTPNYN